MTDWAFGAKGRRAKASPRKLQQVLAISGWNSGLDVDGGEGEPHLRGYLSIAAHDGVTANLR